MARDKGFMILVEGDELSKRVQEAARAAKFNGTELVLSWDDATRQGIPLPRLFLGKQSYGPTTLQAYSARYQENAIRRLLQDSPYRC